MTRRTRGREIALQILYMLDVNPEMDSGEIEKFIERRLREPALCQFARELVAGVRAHQAEIDQSITRIAENWRIDRMAGIDRNILRLGAYEILFCDAVPNTVAINEALELAKRFSTAQSSRFVNGILDHLEHRSNPSQSPDAPPKTAEVPDAPDVLDTPGA
jgi:N utilization substance protein B